jgi:integration host factor subunit beta
LRGYADHRACSLANKAAAGNTHRERGKGFTMLKRELVNNVAEQLQGYYKKDVAMAIDLVLNEIAQALIDGRRVEIRGFGSFSVRNRKPRSTKNPKTGKIMNISARKTLHFTMSKSLKEALIEK